uniref:Uncharacterized protein n=1 Tax=Anguilla anguilla TaxID=7936 RepID=A0A0E9T1L3_ANGAN
MLIMTWQKLIYLTYYCKFEYCIFTSFGADFCALCFYVDLIRKIGDFAIYIISLY